MEEACSMAACRGVGVFRVVNSTRGRADEEAFECMDLLSPFVPAAEVVNCCHRMLSAASDCSRISVLWCP